MHYNKAAWHKIPWIGDPELFLIFFLFCLFRYHLYTVDLRARPTKKMEAVLNKKFGQLAVQRINAWRKVGFQRSNLLNIVRSQPMCTCGPPPPRVLAASLGRIQVEPDPGNRVVGCDEVVLTWSAGTRAREIHHGDAVLQSIGERPTDLPCARTISANFGALGCTLVPFASAAGLRARL